MPRKTKLTPALQQAIVTAVTGGVPYYQACLMARHSLEYLHHGE